MDILMSSVVCCRRGDCSDTSEQLVYCLLWVLVSLSLQYWHTQATQRHQRRRNEQSIWHRHLPWWSTAVHRQLGLYHRGALYLACVNRWSVVRELADDWWAVRLLHAVTDVTSTASDVMGACSSTSVQLDRRTTAACCLDATVHEVPVARRRDNTRHVCRWSPRHARRQGAGCSKWTV